MLCSSLLVWQPISDCKSLTEIYCSFKYADLSVIRIVSRLAEKHAKLMYEISALQSMDTAVQKRLRGLPSALPSDKTSTSKEVEDALIKVFATQYATAGSHVRESEVAKACAMKILLIREVRSRTIQRIRIDIFVSGRERHYETVARISSYREGTGGKLESLGDHCANAYCTNQSGDRLPATGACMFLSSLAQRVLMSV